MLLVLPPTSRSATLTLHHRIHNHLSCFSHILQFGSVFLLEETDSVFYLNFSSSVMGIAWIKTLKKSMVERYFINLPTILLHSTSWFFFACCHIFLPRTIFLFFWPFSVACQIQMDRPSRKKESVRCTTLIIQPDFVLANRLRFIQFFLHLHFPNFQIQFWRGGMKMHSVKWCMKWPVTVHYVV